HVGLAAGPATIGIEIDGAPLVDEAPADNVWLLSMAAGGKAFGVPWCGAGLAHLIQVSHESQHGLILPALINQRLAAAERSTRRAKKIEDERFRLFRVRLSVGLLFGPACAGYKKHGGIRTNRLGVRLRCADSRDGGALRFGRQGHRDFFDVRFTRWAAKRFVASGIQKQDPRTGIALEYAFETLPVEPARGAERTVNHLDRSDMRIHAAFEAMRQPRQGPQ